MKVLGIVFGFTLAAGVASAQALNCDMQEYKNIDGVKAVASGSSVELSWQGEKGQQLRARFTLRNGQH